ncbi:hypothetical protein ABT369_25615 [Dactylosporangium sp. NPDC000244]|uniref:hypothetical protein n=1 Tax=Dactylosporangium sp. NPDC000244 TaxID=3154365 RepID=UPI00331CB1EE
MATPTEGSESTEQPGRGRRHADGTQRAATLRRWRNICLMAAIGLITVAVPPLLIPGDDPAADDAQPSAGPAMGAVTSQGTAAAPSASAGASGGPSSGPATAAPSGTAPSATSGTVAAFSPPATDRSGAVPCATSGGSASPPACTVYTNTLGPGWQVAAANGNVFAAERVPGSDVVAIRIEPKENGTTVWLSAATAATMPASLRLRIYGGRVNGTVARLSLSSTTEPNRSRTVLVNAPADVWTDFTFPVADLLPAGGQTVQRIDLTVVHEAVPHAYRFFVDDIAFV